MGRKRLSGLSPPAPPPKLAKHGSAAHAGDFVQSPERCQSGLSPPALPPKSAKHGSAAHAGDFVQSPERCRIGLSPPALPPKLAKHGSLAHAGDLTQPPRHNKGAVKLKTNISGNKHLSVFGYGALPHRPTKGLSERLRRPFGASPFGNLRAQILSFS